MDIPRFLLSPPLRNGDLFSHLSAHPGIPVATRLTWTIEIAQRVAHLEILFGLTLASKMSF